MTKWNDNTTSNPSATPVCLRPWSFSSRLFIREPYSNTVITVCQSAPRQSKIISSACPPCHELSTASQGVHVSRHTRAHVALRPVTRPPFFFFGLKEMRKPVKGSQHLKTQKPSPHVKVLANHIVHRRDVTCSRDRRAVLEQRTCESFRRGASHHPSPTVPPSVSHRRLHNLWR